jgi:ATP-dependent DNA ligase
MRILQRQWGEGLTTEDMEKCRWLKPRLVATIEYLGMNRWESLAALDVRGANRKNRCRKDKLLASSSSVRAFLEFQRAEAHL